MSHESKRLLVICWMCPSPYRHTVNQCQRCSIARLQRRFRLFHWSLQPTSKHWYAIWWQPPGPAVSAVYGRLWILPVRPWILPPSDRSSRLVCSASWMCCRPAAVPPTRGVNSMSMWGHRPALRWCVRVYEWPTPFRVWVIEWRRRWPAKVSRRWLASSSSAKIRRRWFPGSVLCGRTGLPPHWTCSARKR